MSIPYEFDAETFCRAWLSVAVAAAEDQGRPTLHRAVAIERWSTGVRLTACDSYILWTAFVPAYGVDIEDAPRFEELPDEDHIVIASDEDWRLRDLLKYALKTVTAKDAAPMHLSLEVGPGVLEDGQFPGTERDQVLLSFPADALIGEKVAVSSIDGHYPEWRSLFPAKTGKRTVEELWLNPALVDRVAAVKRWYGQSQVWTFHGPDKAITIEPVKPEDGPVRAPLAGLLMPVRHREPEAGE